MRYKLLILGTGLWRHGLIVIYSNKDLVAYETVARILAETKSQSAFF
jgi:hypothetical protein